MASRVISTARPVCVAEMRSAVTSPDRISSCKARLTSAGRVLGVECIRAYPTAGHHLKAIRCLWCSGWIADNKSLQLRLQIQELASVHSLQSLVHGKAHRHHHGTPIARDITHSHGYQERIFWLGFLSDSAAHSSTPHTPYVCHSLDSRHDLTHSQSRGCVLGAVPGEGHH